MIAGTVEVDVEKDFISRPLWFHKQGLQQTASGYGRRLKTEYLFKWQGRLRRVLCCQISNAGTLYIETKDKNWIVLRA
jgi:hypothetical protein